MTLASGRKFAERRVPFSSQFIASMMSFGICALLMTKPAAAWQSETVYVADSAQSNRAQSAVNENAGITIGWSGTIDNVLGLESNDEWNPPSVLGTSSLVAGNSELQTKGVQQESLLPSTLLPSNQLPNATIPEFVPGEIRMATFDEEAVAEESENAKQTEKEQDAQVENAVKHASQLSQIYQSRFKDNVPLDLINSLAKNATDGHKTLEAKTERSDEEEAELKAFAAAITKLDDAKRFKAETQKLVVETKAAPDQAKILKNASEPNAEKPADDSADNDQSDDAVTKLEKLLEDPDAITVELIAEIDALLEQSTESSETQETRVQKVETSIEEVRKRLAEAQPKAQQTQMRLDEANKQLAAASFDPNKSLSASSLSQLATAITLATRIERDRAELDRDNAIEKQLLPLKKQTETKLLREAEEHVAKLTKIRDEAVRALKQQLAAKARTEYTASVDASRSGKTSESALAHSGLLELAKYNTELAETSTLMTRKLKEAQEELTRTKTLREEQRTSFANLQNKVTVAGTTQTVGLLLRNYRRHLPSIALSYSRVQAIESELPSLNLSRIELEEKQDKVKETLAKPREEVDIAAVLASCQETDEQTNDNQVAPPINVTDELRLKTLKSLDTQSKIIEQLVKDYRAEVDTLSELESETRSLITETNECRFFIDKHVLWIRSAEPLAVKDLQHSLSGVQSVMAVKNWSDLTAKIKQGLRNHPIQAMVGIIVLVALIVFRGRLISRLKRINAQTNSDRITLLLRSLLLSLLLASVYPAVLVIAGLVLKSPYDDTSLKGAASHALLTIGPVFFIASLLYRVSMIGGLAETRLQWNPSLTSTLRKLVMMLTLFCFPMIFVYELMESYNEGEWSSSLGRLGLIAAMIVLGLANMRAFRGVMKFMKEAPPHKLRKLLLQWRWLWLAVFVGGPIALAAFAAMGYSYSALQLGGKMMMTFWAALLIVFGYSVITRVVLMAQQAIAAGIRRRRYFEHDLNDPAQKSEQEHQEKEVERIQAQMQRLLRVSAFAFALVIGWHLWSEVLPAVQILDKVELWHVTKDVAVKSADGSDAKETLEPRRVAITLNHAMLCLGIFALTFVLSRNLPGLLQITFLNRLPIDRGGKYAISIVMRYFVAITGSILAFRMIGFSWDSLQWLVAAMSVGLGFGLQEIFGNFVSGLIILFERPIRVGDMVTVNGTTGWVTRIQLRATTITDLDRREMVVPNKKFITDDIINWTLTDSVTRMTLKVGVAYGSDTKLAEQTLLKVADEHRQVLRDPSPVAHFTSFGDSTLDFELRAFIPNRDIFLQVQHELHMAVDRAFREVGIEIAFPQQDLHIRSVDGEALIRTANVGQASVTVPPLAEIPKREAA